jgi:DNA adenine methylase
LNFPEELCRLIRQAPLNVDEWKKQREIFKNRDLSDILTLGFSFFYLNRCNRSGVLSGGVIGGLNQTGNYKIDARFSREDLIRRIETIAIFNDQITISNFDAEHYISNEISKLPKNSLVYLDPPYYEKGGGLYPNAYKKDDHSRIAKTIQSKIKHKWLLSYDGVDDIVSLYKNRKMFLYDLQYSAAKVYQGREVFIFDDKLQIPTKSLLPQINVGLSNVLFPAYEPSH